MSNTKEAEVLNFSEAWSGLVSLVINLGSRYNPQSDKLKSESLQGNMHHAIALLADVDMAYSANRNAISARQDANRGLSKLIIHLVKAFEATAANSDLKVTVRAIAEKFQPTIPLALATSESSPEGTAKNMKMPNNLKAELMAQLDFDSKVNALRRITHILAMEPTYCDSEPELSIAGLRNLAAELDYHNHMVFETENRLAIAQNRRDDFFYNKSTGLVAVGQEVKNYVQSVYGAASNEAKSISTIQLQ